MITPALYVGTLHHRRRGDVPHRFSMRTFMPLLDVDRIPELMRVSWCTSWNRWNWASFHDTDHTGDPRLPLRDRLAADAARHGIALPDGPVLLLTHLRYLGYVFNPLSVWFCRDAAGALKAVVYEVHNTYGERHAYVLPVEDETLVRHGCAKAFYVSPFLSRDCSYQFRIRPPGSDVAIAIHQDEAGLPVLNASFAGARRALSDGALLRMLFAYPLMTVKVVLAIHFEAVRLMLKGIRRHPHAPKALVAPAE